MPPAQELTLGAAGADCTVDECIDMTVPELCDDAGNPEAIRPYVLETTPNVLSIGRRCMELGYEFHWKKYSLPTFTLPCGKKITLCVDNYIPYLYPGEGLDQGKYFDGDIPPSACAEVVEDAALGSLERALA